MPWLWANFACNFHKRFLIKVKGIDEQWMRSKLWCKVDHASSNDANAMKWLWMQSKQEYCIAQSLASRQVSYFQKQVHETIVTPTSRIWSDHNYNSCLPTMPKDSFPDGESGITWLTTFTMPLDWPHLMTARFIITQNRQAVAVGNPHILLHHLELLLGSTDFAAEIAAQDVDIARLRVVTNQKQLDTDRQANYIIACSSLLITSLPLVDIPHMQFWQGCIPTAYETWQILASCVWPVK